MSELLNAMQVIDAEVKKGRANQVDVECVLKNIETAISDKYLCYKAISSYMEADQLSKELVKDVVDVTFVEREVIAMAVELGKSLSECGGDGCYIFGGDMNNQSHVGFLATIQSEARYELTDAVVTDKFGGVLYEYTDEYGNYYYCTYEKLLEYDDIYQMQRKIERGVNFQELLSMSEDNLNLLDAFRVAYGFNPVNTTEEVFSQLKRVYEYIYGNVEKCFHAFYKTHFNDSYYDVSLWKCADDEFENVWFGLLPVDGIRDIDKLYA